ncbi:DUF748 domain-containing protein [Geobacter pickeringii]|uniref:DUF748 domain-containing protein n=1 Tax=Geobacter pickeringii TaxID=345632 RepID=UPI001F176134|nr:DUF748 domain-containing protein [Geobacter pickeringii]
MRWLALGALVLVAGGAALALYLSTPLAAQQLSRLLTRSLRLPVAIAAVEPRPGGVVLRGLRIGNPEGFPAVPLATADTVTIAPRWLALLGGGRDFRRIEVDGVRVLLARNRSGEWNAAALRKRGGERKPAAELTIGELAVRNGAVAVEGRGVTGINLRLRDFSTRGNTGSQLELAFADAGGSRFRLTGSLRPGPAPDLDLTLLAPAVALTPYGTMLKTRGVSLAGGTGSVRLAVRYTGGLLQGTGDAEVRDLLITTSAGRLSPFTGRVSLAARYEPARDTGVVESLRVELADTVRLRATATVNRLRTGRQFAADIAVGDIDLGRLSLLLPAAMRRDAEVGGVLGGGRVHVAGDARRVSELSGGVTLRDGAFSRGKRPFFHGLTGSAALAPRDGGWGVRGMLSLPRQGESSPLERLDLPFSLSLSERLALRGGEAAPLAARIFGLPVTGGLSYRPTDPRPLSLSLMVPAASLAALAPHLAPFGIRPAGGSAILALRVTGRNARELEGEISGVGRAVSGEARGREVAFHEGVLRTRFAWAGGRLDASGECRVGGARLDGRPGEARFGWHLVGRTVTLTDGLFRLAGTTVVPGRLSLAVGYAEGLPAARRYPLVFDLAEGTVKSGAGEAAGLAASFRGYVNVMPGERWIEGSGAASARAVTLRAAPLGAPSARFSLGRGTAVADLGGSVAGGALSGRLTLDPRNPGEGGAFTLGLREGDLATLAPLLSGTAAVLPTGGRVTVAAEGTFVPATGATCRLEVGARGVALAGSGGKSVLNGGGVALSAAIAGEKATIREATVSLGEGVALRLRGSVDHAWSPRREGELSFSLPRTTVSGIVDPLVNALPRAIQEATIGGAVAARGTVAITGSSARAEGAVTFDGASLDVASQRFTVSGIGGTVPFSLLLGPAAPRRTPTAHSFTKENYPDLLERMRKAPSGGESLTIGSVRFGSLELGETVLHLRAAQGVTEVVSLRSSLYEGALLGTGFVAVQGGLAYGADILVNDLSLRRLCDAFPKIKGYASGRIDGVVSLYGEGQGVAGLVGFTDLWARESRQEQMLLSKEFLQRLAGKKLRGFFFRDDRSYDTGEVSAYLEGGYLTFTTLDVSHTNFLGVRDLSVSVAPIQNRIALEHLFGAIREAAARGKAVRADEPPAEAAPPQTEFQWQE